MYKVFFLYFKVYSKGAGSQKPTLQNTIIKHILHTVLWHISAHVYPTSMQLGNFTQNAV